MDHGLNGHCLKGLCPGDRRPPTRYILRLWAAITIQEDTRNWKDKQTHPVDCRATSPTTQERDSLKSQGRGGQEGPLGDLGSQQEMRRLLKAGRPIGERESTSFVLI